VLFAANVLINLRAPATDEVTAPARSCLVIQAAAF
jgi:hypothetical protein